MKQANEIFGNLVVVKWHLTMGVLLRQCSHRCIFVSAAATKNHPEYRVAVERQSASTVEGAWLQDLRLIVTCPAKCNRWAWFNLGFEFFSLGRGLDYRWSSY